MKFSAPNARRKWPYVGLLPAERLMVIALTGLLVALGQGESNAGGQRSGRPALMPLPKPRPVEAPPAQAPVSGSANGPEKQAASAPRPESACRMALSAEIAVAPGIPDIQGPGGCGGEDLIRLEAVILPDRSRVAVSPPAILRCPMASALAGWVRTDLAPLAAGLAGGISALENLDSFECRGRNRVEGARLSEHGRANAFDLRALKLGNGQSIALTDRNLSHEFRERVLRSLCARFSTVLGPGSDWYHEDHIHLDLIERHNNYRICQWDVWDPLPHIAPQLPPERPEQAPPREIAVNSGPAKSNPVVSRHAAPAGAGETAAAKKRR